MADKDPQIKIVQSDYFRVVPGISWWKSPQVLAALAGISGGIVAFCHAFRIPLPFTASELTEGLAAIASIGACVYFLYRRWRAGRDPENPTATLTK